MPESFNDLHKRINTNYKQLLAKRLKDFSDLGFNKPLALFCACYSFVFVTEFKNIQAILLGPALSELLDEVIEYPTGSDAAHAYMISAAHKLSIKYQLEAYRLPHLIATTNWKITTYHHFTTCAEGLLQWAQCFGEHNQLTYNFVLGALFNRFDVANQELTTSVCSLLRQISGVPNDDSEDEEDDDEETEAPSPKELVKKFLHSRRFNYLQHEQLFSLRNQRPSSHSSSRRSDAPQHARPSRQEGQARNQAAASSNTRSFPEITLQHSGSELMKRLKHYPMRLPKSLKDEFTRIDKSNPKDRSAFARRHKVCYQCLAPTAHCECPSSPSLN